jgi:transcriptional regulator with XRE-family HTH domain
MNELAKMKDRLQLALDLSEKKAIDLARDLNIPKSAISQYLSGNRVIKDSKRLYAIATYLDVSEAWLMGFDVPMERPAELKEKDVIADLVKRLNTDKEFRSLVVKLDKLNPEQIEGLMKLIPN